MLQSKLKGDVKNVADALTEARLLVNGKGEDNQPTLEVAHETVLKGWERLQQWILDHAEVLRARRDLEHDAAEWDKSDRHSSALRSGKLLQRYLSAAQPHSKKANQYLAACKNHRIISRVAYVIVGLLVLTLAGFLVHIKDTEYKYGFTAKALFVQLGILPVERPKMVTIPAGEFEMGDLSGDTDEQYIRMVTFTKPFEMGKYEVTFDEYDLFSAATGRRRPDDEGWTYDEDGKKKRRGQLPVIYVDWDDALAYTKWLSKRTGQNYRLPSEAEWEYAVRAETKTKTSRYWPEKNQGEKDAACTYANVFDTKNKSSIRARYNITWDPFNCPDEFPFTAPVGKFKSNSWGLHDMLGNVWEWTQDCYSESYMDAPTDGSAREFTENDFCSRRVLRGGSWHSVAPLVRSANRYSNPPDYRDGNIGFRLARTL